MGKHAVYTMVSRRATYVKYLMYLAKTQVCQLLADLLVLAECWLLAGSRCGDGRQLDQLAKPQRAPCGEQRHRAILRRHRSDKHLELGHGQRR